MSKAILVMDMPDNCVVCKLSDWATCRFTRKCNTKGRQADCPLRELPERANHPDYCDNGRYDKGWNDYLNEILKGEEDEV